MAEFRVPELGENVAGGDVARVLVAVGDTIQLEQPIVELETDKATIEVPSSVAGVVTEIKVKKGDKIKVGAVILVVDAAGAASAKASTAAATSAESTAAGATSAATQIAPVAPATRASEAPMAVSAPPRPPAALVTVNRGGVAAPAAPSVRRLAREIGVDVNQVPGTGIKGRISIEDVKAHARTLLSGVAAQGTLAVSARAVKPLPDFQKFGDVSREPWTSIRRTTAEHLSHAWTTIPHVTQFDKADLTALDALRKQGRDQVAKAGGNLTVTAMLVRIVAAAVKQFPQFNASLDTERGEIVFKRYVHIGVAVDTDRGLLVPVIRHADQKNITEIAVELQKAAERARERKLSIDDMSGGSMTISNLGGIGGTAFTPIVNWPEVAILGVSRGAVEPVWRPAAAGLGTTSGTSGSLSGTFEPRLMLPLSLSYDHRVIDGADAMRFLRWVVEAIEQPFLLSLLN